MGEKLFWLYKLCSLKCSVSGESASEEELSDPGEKLILGDVVEVPSIFAVDDKGSASYTPNLDDSNCLNVRL